MPNTELELLRGDEVVRVIPLEDAVVTLGRDLGNGVVLVDESVSGHHAVVQRGGDGTTVRDLGSTNGTWVNGVRIETETALHDGDELRLGPDVRLRVRHVGSLESGYVVVRDVAAGTLHVVDTDRFHIGSGSGAAIRLPGGPARAATLLVHPDGEAWLGTPDGERPVAIGETFEVSGSTFVLELVPEDTRRAPTARPMLETRYAYRLTVTLGGAAGTLAVLEDSAAGKVCEIRPEARVALLYQLGRRLQADREAGVLPALAGWCHDEDLMIGVWGREGLTGAPSRYSVLLHRVRKDIEAAGLDPWCLEKRRGGTRLHIETLILA